MFKCIISLGLFEIILLEFINNEVLIFSFGIRMKRMLSKRGLRRIFLVAQSYTRLAQSCAMYFFWNTDCNYIRNL